jgi:hypothetical protein
MAKLTKKYIEDHLVGTHTEESWARAINELVLRSAIAQLGDGSAEEVAVDATFRVKPVEAIETSADGKVTTRLCIETCVVVSPSGLEVCFHKEALK